MDIALYSSVEQSAISPNFSGGRSMTRASASSLGQEFQEQVIRDTRKRKGLKPEPPKPDEFMEK
jgi:hypothetical protein